MNVDAVHQFAHVSDLFITSKIGAAKARAGPYRGQAILSCFGFGYKKAAYKDHLVLLVIGAAADALTALSFSAFAFERR